jgi:hypothetical protein
MGGVNMLWGLKWRQKNRKAGKKEHIMYNAGVPMLFTTRSQAKEYADQHYGYIKVRADLRAEPHGWKMPLPVKITIKEKK